MSIPRAPGAALRGTGAGGWDQGSSAQQRGLGRIQVGRIGWEDLEGVGGAGNVSPPQALTELSRVGGGFYFGSFSSLAFT